MGCHALEGSGHGNGDGCPGRLNLGQSLASDLQALLSLNNRLPHGCPHMPGIHGGTCNCGTKGGRCPAHPNEPAGVRCALVCSRPEGTWRPCQQRQLSMVSARLQLIVPDGRRLNGNTHPRWQSLIVPPLRQDVGSEPWEVGGGTPVPFRHQTWSFRPTWSRICPPSPWWTLEIAGLGFHRERHLTKQNFACMHLTAINWLPRGSPTHTILRMLSSHMVRSMPLALPPNTPINSSH